MHKKKRRSIIDELFDGSLFAETDEILEAFEKGEISGGYSISVTQTPEGTKVYAKVGKDVNVNELKRQLQQQYPNAQIYIEGGSPLIKEISTKIVEEDEKSDEENPA
jgi:hypothetical protein